MKSSGGCLSRLLLLTLIAAFAYGGYIGMLVWQGLSADNRRPADAIVVLGAAQYNGRPSPVLRARLDHAADLYEEGLAPKIVVTGGSAPGDLTTEAGASAAYLARRGVPDSDVLREVQGRNSWESLKASARFMEARGIESVVLVSDPFHGARITEMADDLGLEPVVSPTRTSPLTGGDLGPYLFKEWLHLALGKALGFDTVAGLEKSFASGSNNR